MNLLLWRRLRLPSTKSRWWRVTGVGFAAVLMGALVLWLLPVLLTAGSSLGEAERQKALSDARTGVMAFLLAIGAVGSLLFTARTFRLSQTGQVTERYSRAIELLGSKSVDVRIGAIFALERIAVDSPGDQPTIVEVLSAFVREHAKVDSRTSDNPPTADVLAAVRVIGRRRYNAGDRALDLAGCNLQGADLHMAYLPSVNFAGSDLRGVGLSATGLTGANFTNADLRKANFSGAQLFMARFVGADASKAMFTQASMFGAFLHCNLTGAHLDGADMRGVHWLEQSTLTAADFSGVYLQEKEREVIAAANVEGMSRIEWEDRQPIPVSPRPLSPTPHHLLPQEFWDRRPPGWHHPRSRSEPESR